MLKLYKRVSLDDDLEEEMRAELLSVLVSGASNAIQTLHLVKYIFIREGGCWVLDSKLHWCPSLYNHFL